MDFLTGRIRPMYSRYLAAAFGSALISFIYGAADMAMVGQYQGPSGTAALAVVSPVWNIIYSLWLLMGIGGSVLFSTLRGEAEENRKKSNEYFTAALIGVILLTVLAWAAVIFFDTELLRPFGAEETLLPLARQYLFPVKFTVPGFLLLPLNIFSTYCFQAWMKPSVSSLVPVSRGAVISGILIYLLPAVAGANAIWFAMPITELLAAIAVAVAMARCTRQLPTAATWQPP